VGLIAAPPGYVSTDLLDGHQVLIIDQGNALCQFRHYHASEFCAAPTHKTCLRGNELEGLSKARRPDSGAKYTYLKSTTDDP
jgi:hypothetical protein